MKIEDIEWANLTAGGRAGTARQITFLPEPERRPRRFPFISCDTTWPDTQERRLAQIESCSPEEIEKVTWRTASDLFRPPVPESVQRDPESF